MEGRGALAGLLLLLLPAVAMGLQQATIEPGATWTDQGGSVIQAHGGGILLHEGTYYWFGEDKSGRQGKERTDVVGVHCYSSTDLGTWKDEGLVLKAAPGTDLDPSRVLERPKVIYNRKTRKFVMWMHIDSADYKDARAGVAWANSPTGPYTYVGSARPNGEESRDMTVFQDDDGQAWLLYSSEDNKVLHITQLSEDYLSVGSHFTRALVGLAREAPAAFKYQGRYFLLTSGCTSWDPNRAEVFRAPAMEGPWTSLGDPCKGEGSVCKQFFKAQSTFVLPLGKRGGRFLLMADRWNKDSLGSSKYIWLPLEVRHLGGDKYSASVEWRERWGLKCRPRRSRKAGLSCRFDL